MISAGKLRVKKQVGAGTATVYVFSGSKVIAEYAAGGATGSPLREYIYAGSQLLATIEGSSTKYHHADHLSARFTTDASGGNISEQGHYPFGENWYTTGTASKWKFTTYERDGGTGESGNDYAMFRYHISRLGRFNAPDPIAGSIADPQSLNRYAYVRNDPLNLADPTGLTVQLEPFNVADWSPFVDWIDPWGCGSDDWGWRGGRGGGADRLFGGWFERDECDIEREKCREQLTKALNDCLKNAEIFAAGCLTICAVYCSNPFTVAACAPCIKACAAWTAIYVAGCGVGTLLGGGACEIQYDWCRIKKRFR